MSEHQFEYVQNNNSSFQFLSLVSILKIVFTDFMLRWDKDVALFLFTMMWCVQLLLSICPHKE